MLFFPWLGTRSRFKIYLRIDFACTARLTETIWMILCSWGMHFGGIFNPSELWNIHAKVLFRLFLRFVFTFIDCCFAYFFFLQSTFSMLRRHPRIRCSPEVWNCALRGATIDHIVGCYILLLSFATLHNRSFPQLCYLGGEGLLW